MKKLLYLLCLAFLVVGFSSCENDNPLDNDKNNPGQNDGSNDSNNSGNNSDNNSGTNGDGGNNSGNNGDGGNNSGNNGDINGDNSGNNGSVSADEHIDPEYEVLSPSQQQKKLIQVGDEFINQFSTTDFKSIIKLIDECTYKFEDYSWEAYEENILNIEKFLGQTSKIITEAQTGGLPVELEAYIFEMSRISAIYEANDIRQTWKVTPTNDGKLTIRFTNLLGEDCEIVIACSNNTYDIVSFIDNYDSAQPFEVKVPESISIKITEGGYEHMNATCNIKIQKNKLFDLEWNAKIASLRFKVKSVINNTSAQATFSVDQYNQNLITITSAAPTCTLLGKKDSDSYEEWFDKYVEAFKYNKTLFGDLTATCNIMNRIQIIATSKDPMNIINELDNIDYYDDCQYAIAVADYLNDNMECNLYYSSNVLQSSLLWDVTSDEYEYYDWYENRYVTRTYYDYTPVLYFPEENTSYSFGEYFTTKVYSGLIQQVEDLCNSYIKLLKYINIEPIEF